MIPQMYFDTVFQPADHSTNIFEPPLPGRWTASLIPMGTGERKEGKEASHALANILEENKRRGRECWAGEPTRFSFRVAGPGGPRL